MRAKHTIHTHAHTLSTHLSSVNVVLVRRVSASARAPSGPMLLLLRLMREGGEIVVMRVFLYLYVSFPILFIYKLFNTYIIVKKKS